MKKIGFFIIIIIIIISSCVLVINLTKLDYEIKERPNYDYIATIHHSENDGIDAGHEYNYDIYSYKSATDKAYFFIKSTAQITIAGLRGKEDISSGNIKNKTDLYKIEKDIKKDSRTNMQQHISYIYVNNGISVECKDIEELANKLFK